MEEGANNREGAKMTCCVEEKRPQSGRRFRGDSTRVETLRRGPAFEVWGSIFRESAARILEGPHCRLGVQRVGLLV